MASREVSEIDRPISDIEFMHKEPAMKDASIVPPGECPKIKMLMADISRTIARNENGKTSWRSPLTIDHIEKLRFSETLIGVRDKALLRVGFAGGLRRSELVSIRVNHLEPISGGISIYSPHSKTDREVDREEYVSIVYCHKHSEACPVDALGKWIEQASINSGCVFRAVRENGRLQEQLSDTSIYLIVRKYAAQAGFNPKSFGGHSLRFGCATYLLDNSVAPHIAQKHLRYDTGGQPKSHCR